MPTLYTYRKDLSLFDAQYDEDGKKIPIPEEVIQSVIASLLHFKTFCSDFGVPAKHIRILATEATRTADNSAEYRARIMKATGLKVELLSKQDEGEIGAWGIASGFSNLQGLVMDLGGGSTQITWMTMTEGLLETSPTGAISFPYGAGALTKKLHELAQGKTEDEADRARAVFRNEMKTNFRKAYEDLKIPNDMIDDAKQKGGFPIYLTGGGFRGWGYLLLHQSQVHGNHYPISIINGFTAHKDAFQDTEALKKVARDAENIFRVSDRRRAQVPAVAFLINVLAEALPYGIRDAHFCQGGVREGVLFHQLPKEIRIHDPLEVATAPYARPFAPKLSQLLRDALPTNDVSYIHKDDYWKRVPKDLDIHLIAAMSNMFYVHSDRSKELASTAALYSTSTGLLASTHGVSHSDRALLALLLEARYEGDMPPREVAFKESLCNLLTPEEVWWTEYLGSVALVLSRVYPAGNAEPEHSVKGNLRLSTSWLDNGKKGLHLAFTLRLRPDFDKDLIDNVKENLESHTKAVKKVGKKKHWIGGRDGWGLKTVVSVHTI